MAAERPGTVTAAGVLCIIYGSVGVLCGICGVISLVMQASGANLFAGGDALQAQLQVEMEAALRRELRERFGARVVTFESIRHESGELAGQGPTGRIMPAYLTGDRDRAARSGEEAVIEYLLLCRCDYLVHNGSGIPRMVLLTVPGMPADNTLPRQAYWRRAIANRSWLPLARVAGLWRHRAGVAFRAMANQPVARWYPVLRDLWASRGQADGAMAGDRFRS